MNTGRDNPFQSSCFTWSWSAAWKRWAWVGRSVITSKVRWQWPCGLEEQQGCRVTQLNFTPVAVTVGTLQPWHGARDVGSVPKLWPKWGRRTHRRNKIISQGTSLVVSGTNPTLGRRQVVLVLRNWDLPACLRATLKPRPQLNHAL